MRFTYWVVRYVPSPVREEFVNVAVIAGDGTDWALRRVHNLQRASRLGGSATVTSSFLARMADAIDQELDTLATSLLDHPHEQIGHALITDLAVRMNGLIQLSPPRPIRAESADEAADLAFDLMVVDEGQVIRHRSRTLVARRAHQAFADEPDLATHLVQARQARVEDQRVSYDVALSEHNAVQLTQAWSFDLQNLSRLETSIQAWNYLMGRIRHRGGELVRPRNPHAPSIDIPADVDINVLYRPPSTSEGKRQFDIARRGWDELNIHPVPEESLDTLITEARRLITA